jgi:thiamine-phosphate pyrophosphorylase
MVARRRPSLEVCAVTSRGLVPGRGHLEVARAAVEGGASAVQLRAPELDDEHLLPLAETIAKVCAERGVLFIVNDRLDVAIAAGAGGVHLGQLDDPSGARPRLGDDRVLGISVGSPEEARRAELVGADYVGATVWSTSTKPEAIPVGLEGLRAICASTPLPVVGIGGVEARNAPDVIRAGAKGVAVVSAIGGAPSPAEATRLLRRAVGRAVRSVRGAGP